MSGCNFQKKYCIFGRKIFFTLANSVGPDEIQHYAAFHLGLHCLPKYSFRGFSNTKGLNCITLCVPYKCPLSIQVKINKNVQRKIVNIFIPISFNICSGCSKEPSH